MTKLRVKGVHAVTVGGKVYYYHRATRKRIAASPDDPAAFAAEVAGLDVFAPKVEAPKLHTLGGLIAAYKRSPEWQALKPDTQKGYERAFNALKPSADVLTAVIEQKDVLHARDAVFAKHKRWLANMVVSVLSVVLGWGVPRGYTSKNAAAGVPKIRRAGLGVANPAWTWAEVDAMLKRATGGLRKAVALAYFTGMRKKDIVELRRAARVARSGAHTGEIEFGSSKPDRNISVFEAKRLSAILDEPDTKPGEFVVVNEAGQPYTRDGLDTMFDRLKRTLTAEGLLRPRRTFHGLRKSLGKDLAEAGFSENDIAGALGQANPASARPYTIEAQQKAAAKRTIKALERRGKR